MCVCDESKGEQEDEAEEEGKKVNINGKSTSSWIMIDSTEWKWLRLIACVNGNT